VLSWWNCEDHVGSYAGFSVTRRSVGMAFRHLDNLPRPPWAGKELLAQQIVEPRLPRASERSHRTDGELNVPASDVKTAVRR
jgi:hypothetical protein